MATTVFLGLTPHPHTPKTLFCICTDRAARDKNVWPR
jgi:hypothetical protein